MKKWDYPENNERIQNLQKALIRAKSINKITSIAIALKRLDNIISQEIDRIDACFELDGDRNALLTQRRQVRQLKNKARW